MRTLFTLASNIRLFTKEAVQTLLPAEFPPTLVASMGRSGSTVAHEAAVSGLARARFSTEQRWSRALCRGEAFDLRGTEFKDGVVYKTHGYPAELPAPFNGKILYLFARPSDVVLSVMGCEAKLGPSWFTSHLQHMGSEGSVSELPYRDVLKLDKQIEAWLSPTIRVLAIRYERMWENQNSISKFLGFEFRLPSRFPSRTSYSIAADTISQVRSTYAELDQFVASLPD